MGLPRGAISNSSRENWRTPPEVFDPINVAFRFAVDLAADKSNALCPTWITEAEDALVVDWHRRPGPGWWNPPYARGQVARWCEKAREEARLGFTSVGLLPANTGDRWFARDVLGVAEVVFITPRVRFLKPDGRPAGSPTFGSILAIYRPGLRRPAPSPLVFVQGTPFEVVTA